MTEATSKGKKLSRA